MNEWAVVAAQLVESLLPITGSVVRIQSLAIVIYSQLVLETENKGERGREGPIFFIKRPKRSGRKMTGKTRTIKIEFEMKKTGFQ